MPNACLEINLFARVRLVVAGVVVDRLPTQRVAALLAYFVLHPGWQPRERIAEAIWSDLPEGKAAASLRNALSTLRRVLEPNGPSTAPVIEATRTHARICRELCDCDVWEFQSAIASNQNALAISLYQGELLSDLHDEWLEPFRENLRNSFIAAVSREATRALTAGEHEQALAYAERWSKSEPFDPQASKVLVLALAGTGRAQAALNALQRFVEEYQRELGLPPEIDVASIRSDIEVHSKKAATAPRPVPNTSTAPPRERGDRRMPLYLTRFFGRENELCQIDDWAQSPSQLLTIVGMGGIGKTRIAIEAGRSLGARGRDVLFVSLADADTEDALIASLMNVLELRESETDTPKQVIESYLAQQLRPTILILDNLEQLVKAAAKLVMDLLGTNEGLKFLCTSRELLGIEGEQLLALRPLETSEENELHELNPAQVVQRQTAVQMFVDRARSSRADFSLTTRNYQEVAALCHELDGLPLAIEIMAAWSGTWSIAEMRKNVRNERVVARKRGHDPRHQSLQACIEWSFNLLEPETQEFLCVLSLFRGGWTLQAAEAITGSEDAQETLAVLVDRSLVSSAEFETGLRFFMLESVRAYCRAKLNEASARNAAPRFVAYFTQLAKTLANPCAGTEERLNQLRLDQERENIEAVVSLCEEALAPVDDGLAIAGPLHLHWVYRGQSRAGIALIERLLRVPTAEPFGLGRILGLQTLSVLAQDTQDVARAEQALQQLQAVAGQHSDWEITFRVLTQMGNFLNNHGKFAGGMIHHARALEIAQAEQVSRMEAVAHCNLAESLFGQDRVAEAVIHWQAATDLDSANGNIAGEAMLFLGFVELLQGHLSKGSRRILLYLRNVHSLGFARGFVRAVYFTALPATQMHRLALARQLIASSQAFIDQKAIVYDTLERKCTGIVDLAIKQADPSFGPEATASLDIEEAVSVAVRFLESAASNPNAADS